MQKRKTAMAAFVGTFLIIIGVFWGNFGTLNLRFLTEDPYYEYSAEDLSQSVTDYEIIDNQFTALSDDAWIELKYNRKSNIKSIELYLTEETISDPIQIYYSSGKEYDGSDYEEAVLHSGDNLVELGGIRGARKLRLDLTQHSGEDFSVEKIIVREEYTKRLYFWVFTPVILLCYWIACIILVNRNYIRRRLQNSTKWSKQYNLVDQVFSLAFSDFKARFSGSYLGIFWGIIQPLSTILLFWFVFQIGFRSQPIDNVPFILWLSAGMIPWNYFYDSWFGGTSSFTQYSYIVKKVVFRIEVLPLVKVLSASLLNCIFNGILLIIYSLYGYFPGFHIFDMIYFSICFGALTLGLSYITASLNVFIKDVGQFLGIALQFMMWMTPMMWVYTTIPEQFSWFYKLNPLHYVINGYRESLINGHWFYYQYKEMIWFWFVTLALLIYGKKLMKRLSPHFADVL